MKKSGKTNPEPLMRRDITYIQGVQMEEAVEIVRHCSFRDEEMEVIERILRSPEEFHNVYITFSSQIIPSFPPPYLHILLKLYLKN